MVRAAMDDLRRKLDTQIAAEDSKEEAKEREETDKTLK